MVVAFERPYSESYEKMFFMVERALINNGYEITAKDYKIGKILASKGIRASFFKNRWGILIFVRMGVSQGNTHVHIESKTVFWNSNIDVIPLFVTLDNLLVSSEKVLIEPFKSPKTSKKFIVKNPNALCPSCKYRYTSMSAIDLPDQESAISICPRCHHEYYYVISEQLKPKIERSNFGKNQKDEDQKHLEVVTTRPVIYGAILSFFSIIAFLTFSDTLLWRIILSFPTIYIVIGTYLISKRKFKLGCILCGTAGVFLIPIGVFGLFAADLAWKYHKWYS